MRKILMLGSVLLLLTACTNQPTTSQLQDLQATDQQAVADQSQTTDQQAQNFDESIEINGKNMKSEELLQAYTKAIIHTSMGDIKVKFYGQDSPNTVANFLKLSYAGFYNGTRFHRVIKDFMIQAGDPNSRDSDWSNDGLGGPGYMFDDEFNNHKLVAGSLAMANAGPDTNGSQFFIVTAESTPWLDGKHTNFGEVVEGMDIIKAIEAVKVNENDHPLQDITIDSIELLK
jgi:peptidyl-prolyl cis-trans isomerase B (cyclophilin B)